MGSGGACFEFGHPMPVTAAVSAAVGSLPQKAGAGSDRRRSPAVCKVCQKIVVPLRIQLLIVDSPRFYAQGGTVCHIETSDGSCGKISVTLNMVEEPYSVHDLMQGDPGEIYMIGRHRPRKSVIKRNAFAELYPEVGLLRVEFLTRDGFVKREGISGSDPRGKPVWGIDVARRPRGGRRCRTRTEQALTLIVRIFLVLKNYEFRAYPDRAGIGERALENG